jgi:hypothetical protein
VPLSVALLLEAQVLQVCGRGVEHPPSLGRRHLPAELLLHGDAGTSELEIGFDSSLLSSDSSRCAKRETETSSDEGTNSESANNDTCDSSR